jgi:ribonuclease E
LGKKRSRRPRRRTRQDEEHTHTPGAEAAPDRDDASQAEQPGRPAEQADPREGAGEPPKPARSRRSSRRGGRRRRDAQAGETAASAAAGTPTTPVAEERAAEGPARTPPPGGTATAAEDGRDTRTTASKASVEKLNDAIVIRFPPAARPPGRPAEVAASLPAVEDEALSNGDRMEQAAAMLDELEAAVHEPVAPAANAPLPAPTAAPPPAQERTDLEPVQAENGSDGTQRLSSSQRRRQRRRRGGRAREGGGGGPPGEGTAVVADEAQREGRRDPRAPADSPTAGRAVTAAELGHRPETRREGGPAGAAREGAAPSAEEAERPHRRRRRRRSRRRERDDVAGATDAEHVAGVSEPEAGVTFAFEEEEEEAPPEAEEAEVRPPPTDLSVPARKEMIINVAQREECRIAILESGRLEEIYMERASAESHVYNIYKGIVTNVEPSIQAAFVDFGLGKNGFLHISDLHPQYFPAGERHTENVGRKMPRRSRPPIQRCLRRGQEVLVQITKEGIGTKGPTLTTYLSIPGRFLVMMPGMRRLGVSRKIEDDDIREKLRGLMHDLDLPEDMGFIARTAAQGRTKRELQSDLNYLSRLWKAVDKRIHTERAPAELYRESDLVIRTIRDVFTSDVERIVVDNHEVAERAREFLAIFSPRSRDLVVEYDDPAPVFHRYGIETELERLHSRHVPLRSGGSLVIDQTEALVAIDVNSGKFRTEDDAETTAYKINQEAADEIPRQLRLRDLGGVIICDFIDMRAESHRREIERRLIANLKQHKERAKVLRMSAFGIIEMTRQRQRASLTRSVYQDCHHCRGTGLVKTVESVVLDVMRLLQLATTRESVSLIEVSVSPEVAHLLQNRKRSALHELETRNRRTIVIRPETAYGLDQVQIQCYDPRGRVVPHH